MSYYTIHGITNTVSGGTSDINEKASNDAVNTNANTGVSTEKVAQIENTISNLRAQINRVNNIVNQYEKLPAQLNALTSVVNSIRANTFKLATTRDYSAEHTNVYNTQYINSYLDTNMPRVWDDTNRLLEATDKDVYSATYIQNIPNISAIPTVYENTSKTVKTLRDPLVYSVSVVDEIAARTPKYHYVRYSDNDNSTAVYNTSYINSLPIPDSLLSKYNPNPRTNDVYTAKYINNEIEARIPRLVRGPGDVIDPDKNGYTAGYINSLHIPSDILYTYDTHESTSYNYDSTMDDVYNTYYIDRLLNVHTFTNDQSTTYTENALMVKLYDDNMHKQELSGKRRIQMYGHTAQTYMFRPTSNALSIEYFAGDFLPDAEGTQLMQITNTGAIMFKNLVVGNYLESNNSEEDIVMVTRDVSTSLSVKDYFGLSQNHNPYALIQRHVYRDTLTTHYDIDLIEGSNVYHPIAMTNSSITLNSPITVNATTVINDRTFINSSAMSALEVFTKTHAHILLGKSEGSNNCATIRYRNDATPYLGLGFYGNDDIVKLYTDHKLTLENGNLNLIQTNEATDQAITFTNNSNDCSRIRFYNRTDVNTGALEIATGDNADEPIYVRQYTGNVSGGNGFTTLVNEAILLDAGGNTQFPNTLTTKHLKVIDSTNPSNVIIGNAKIMNNNNVVSIGTTSNDAIVQITDDTMPLITFNDSSRLQIISNAVSHIAEFIQTTATNANADTSLAIGTALAQNKSFVLRYLNDTNGNTLYTGLGYYGNDDVIKLYTSRDVEFNNGNINLVTATNKDQQIHFTHGTDYARLRFYDANNSTNDGVLELAVADDGNEQIVARKYYHGGTTNHWKTVRSEVKILDKNGNSSFTGNVTAPQFIATDTMKVLTPNENTTSLTIGNAETTNNSAVITYHNDTSPHSVTIGFTNNEDIFTVKADGTAHASNLAYKDVNTIHYYFTALRSQSWGYTNHYKAYKLGYVKTPNQKYSIFAGTIDVTINCTNHTSESFIATLKYGSGGSTNQILKIDGAALSTNSIGQGAVSLVQSTTNTNVYAIYVLSTGYTYVDGVGFQVRCYMPKNFKLYSDEECTIEQNQERYADNITTLPIATIFTDIYWNNDIHALKDHTHDDTYTRIDSLVTPNSQPTATLTCTKSVEEDTNVTLTRDLQNLLVYNISPSDDYTIYINDSAMSSQQITLNGVTITYANNSLTFSASTVLDVSFTITLQRNSSDLRNKYWFTCHSALPQDTTYTLNTTSREGIVIKQAMVHTHTVIENDLQINGELTTTGDIHCGGMITQTSDRTMKQNIESLENNVIDNIHTYKFTFKNDATNHTHYGVIAQELQEICPELVHEDSKTHKLSVNYIELIPHLVQKVQCQTTYIHCQTGAIAVLFTMFIVFAMYYFLH